MAPGQYQPIKTWSDEHPNKYIKQFIHVHPAGMFSRGTGFGLTTIYTHVTTRTDIL